MYPIIIKMNSFYKDLEYLNKQTNNKEFPASVILLTFRAMLRNNRFNKDLRDSCKSYIDRVINRSEREGPEHDKWCDIIVNGLSNALEGNFSPIYIPLEKMQVAKGYDGPLKKYYEHDI